MSDLSNDPIINVLHNSIKKGIRTLLAEECYGPALVLIYSGIDTMAYLGMPEPQEDVTRTDFVNWVDKYIRFPCQEQLTGFDLYGARCGLLHTYSITSRLHRQGKCRQLGYTDRSSPEIRFVPRIADDFVIVSIEALASSFFEGIDRFIVDLYTNSDTARIADDRFKGIIQQIPIADLDD